MRTLRPLLCIIAFVVPTFSFSQILTEQFKPVILSYPKVTAIAFQPDGKMIVAGDIVVADNVDVKRIVRLHPDGSLDPTFDPPAFISADAEVLSILVDNDGKIMVGGSFSASTGIIRLNEDGSIDESFSFTDHDDYSVRMGVLKIRQIETDKYLVFHYSTSRFKPIVVLNNDGTVDKAIDSFAPGDGFWVEDIIVQPDGKIIVVGEFKTFNHQNFHNIVRLNPDGSIDDTFSTGSGFGGVLPRLNSAIVRPNGRILVAGRFYGYNGASASNIVQLMPDGKVDPEFVLSGPLASYFDLGLGINRMVAFKNGIVATGHRATPTPVLPYLQYSLLKIHDDGTLDNTFQDPRIDLFGPHWPYPLLETNSQELLFGGAFVRVGETETPGLALLNESGKAVSGFKQTLRGRSEINAIVRQENGKLLIGGVFNYVDSIRVNNIVRISRDGSLDDSFLANLGTGPDDWVLSVRLDSDQKIIVGGSFTHFNNVDTGILLRLNRDGSLDQTFSVKIDQHFGGRGVSEIEILPDGKILAGGSFQNVNDIKINNLVRLSSDGSIDNSFNNSLLTDYQFVRTICRQANGDLLVAGGYSEGFLIKTSADGTIINDFNEFDFNNNPDLFINVIKELPNQNFVASGELDASYDVTPIPVFQFDKDGNLLDESSIKVLGIVNDISVTDSTEIVLGGHFSKVNNVPASGLTVVKLNGVISEESNYAIGGHVNVVYRPFTDRKIFLVGGPFFSIDDEVWYNYAGVFLDGEYNDSGEDFGDDDDECYSGPPVQQTLLSNSPYPNPSTDELIINLEEQNTRVTIYKSTGEIYYSETHSDKELQLDIESYSPGIYLIQLETEKKRSLHRIIKL